MNVLDIDIVQPLFDRGIVTDYAEKYGEPGYSLADGACFLIGDWWCRDADCKYADGLHDIQSHHPRVWAALEEAGWETAFYDEWIVIDGKAYRTQPDSYSWQATAVYDEDYGDYLTPDDDIETWVEYMVNNPRKCLRSGLFTDDELAGQGFRILESGLESGWHPGQTDDPEAITRTIREEHGDDVDVLFMLEGVGQFDIRFCVLIRDALTGSGES
jgi:hypothetical protein